MSLASFILKVDSLVKNPTLDRTVKAVIAIVAAQGALYTTVVPNPPSLPASGAVAGGTGLVVAIISLVVTWASKSQAKQLKALADAVDAAVNERLSAQAQAQAPGNAA